MKIHKMSLDDTFDDEFYVIAVYSDEEDYRLAFLLNENLGLKLNRSHSIVNKKTKAEFSIFEYDDISMYRNWFLLQNHSLIEKEVVKPRDLFSQDTTLFQQKVHFIKELKKARFLLKIITDEGNEFVNDIIKKLESIPQLYAVELVDLARLKNNKLLFF